MRAMLILWLVEAMLRWTLPVEKRDEERARYAEIARDAVTVAFDPEERPLFAGSLGRTKTAALLLSIASLESNFRADVDDGRKRGDKGQSWCLMQVNIGQRRILVEGRSDWAYATEPGEGWSGQELVEDRTRCFRAALHIARVSFRACKNLSLYTTGRCQKAERFAQHREGRAKALFKTPLAWTDAEVLDGGDGALATAE